MPPPQLDAFGLGIRFPTWVISRFAKPSHLEPTVYDLVSILKFLETNFSLPTLASMNLLFDESTPGGSNYEAAAGQPTGPPAPPRDELDAIGNLLELLLVLKPDPQRSVSRRTGRSRGRSPARSPVCPRRARRHR